MCIGEVYALFVIVSGKGIKKTGEKVMGIWSQAKWITAKRYGKQMPVFGRDLFLKMQRRKFTSAAWGSSHYSWRERK